MHCRIFSSTSDLYHQLWKPVTSPLSNASWGRKFSTGCEQLFQRIRWIVMLQTHFQHHQSFYRNVVVEMYIYSHTHTCTHIHMHTHTHTHTHTHAYTHRVINKITLENRFWDSDVCLQEVWSRGMFSGTSPEKDQGKQDWAEGEPPTGPYLGTRYSLSSGGNLSDALQHPLQTHIWVFWLFHCNSLDIRKHVNQDWKVISKWQ